MREPFLVLALLLPCSLLAACSETDSTGEVESVDSLTASAADVVLRGECSAAGARAVRFELDPRERPTLREDLGFYRQAFVSLEASIGPAPDHAVRVRTMRAVLWSVGETVSQEVDLPAPALGTTFELVDERLVGPTPYVCRGALVPRQPVYLQGGAGRWPLTALVGPDVTIDVPIPNHVACGADVAFPSSVTTTTVDAFLAAVTLSTPGQGPVAHQFDPTRHILSLSIPEATGWDGLVEISGRDRRRPLADVARGLGIDPAAATIRVRSCR
jgi:hypothetical protein